MRLFPDIITAGEKQAAQSDICVSEVINEQTSDEIGHGARSAGLRVYKE